MLTAAQHAERHATKHEPFASVCNAIEAEIRLCRDIDPDLLTDLGNRLCRMADEVEREQRGTR